MRVLLPRQRGGSRRKNEPGGVNCGEAVVPSASAAALGRREVELALASLSPLPITAEPNPECRVSHERRVWAPRVVCRRRSADPKQEIFDCRVNS